ncbi:MAG: aminotransferase class I/II-fold pyridoxal phosphate-dependent enzyme [Candidatus Malihini olakiniferum]
MTRFFQRQDLQVLNYGNMYGAPELREQIARLAMDSGCQLAVEDIVITTGCQEALFTILCSPCREGDIVAVESHLSRYAANTAWFGD